MERTSEVSDVVISARGAKLTKRWNPKDWKPVYEAMVALVVLGRRNQGDIAKEFGYTEAWLSQIMNSEKGKEVQLALIMNTRNQVVGDTSARLRQMQEIALGRMEQVLADDKLAERSALAIFDRSALFLKNTGVIGETVKPPVVSSSITTINNNNTLIVSSKNADDLREGLKKADEVKVLHQGELKSVVSGSLGG